jgi:hypothetical protein
MFHAGEYTRGMTQLLDREEKTIVSSVKIEKDSKR